jgi:hypothetical protein
MAYIGRMKVIHLGIPFLSFCAACTSSASKSEGDADVDTAWVEPAPQASVSIVRIDTRDVLVDERIEDRSWVTVDIELIESEGDNDATFNGPVSWSGQAGLHIRGNSTVSYDKKQYALEGRNDAGEDADFAPFGLPIEEDWVLQAPYSDKTLMRNHLMYTWSRSIGRYAARTHFVELYMEDGGDTLGTEDYRGVYVLMEKIKRNEHRVNIEKLGPADTTSPAINGGYLLKRDWLEGHEVVTELYEDELVLEYPKPDKVTGAQHAYIESYLNQFEQALERADGSHTEFADIDSFVDHMLMAELSRDVDAYVLSTYMHKSREGLLNMGPIWDFNGALGNADYFESWETEGWHYENSEFPADNPNGFHWYEQLLQDDDYQKRLTERWTEHRLGPWSDESLMLEIDKTVTLLRDAQVRNFERWPVLGESIWPNDAGAEDRETYEEEIEYLKQWILDRTAWLDTQWME